MRRFVSDFLLPVVRGGAAHVGRPLGLDLVMRMIEQPPPVVEAAALEKLAACRAASATRVSALSEPPPFDENTARLGAALHDLLALGHPEVGGGRSRRAEQVATAALELASIGAPPSAREAVNRHSLLARLPEIVRVDRTVHYWLGRLSYVGRRPPPRVTTMPKLRRVRVEETSRSWLREIGIPVVGRAAFLALNVASPLGEALDPLRLDPPVAWGRILPVLRFPTLARVVAGQAVAIGVDRSGDALADALYRFASFHDPPPGLDASPDAVAFALRFLAHLVWLDVLFTGRPREETSTESADIDHSLEPGVDLAVMLTAAARTARGLVWPGDVPDGGDLADAFRARLDALAERAQVHGMPRYTAALGVAELAAAPTTARVTIGPLPTI
ncbi:MAG TPA: hypothetical protein VIF57_31060 [Polyangia bacterium]|jgi:hypothetical protein